MKKIILICIAFLRYTSAVQASCWYNDYQGYDCISFEFDVSGNPASCGEGCSYTYDNGTVTITATENYGSAKLNTRFFSKAMWEGDAFTDENGNTANVQNIIVDGFTSFMGAAFLKTPSTIQSKDGTLILDDVDWNAFEKATLTGNIIWAGDSDGGFNHQTKIAGNLIIEDTASVSGKEGNDFSLLSGGKVFCKTDIEKCQNLLRSAGATADFVSAVEAFPKGCEALSLDATCGKCQNSRFRLTQGKCHRIIYTIEEANRVAGEKNRVSIKYR